MRARVYELLKSALEIDVYQDFVPENAKLPACSFVNISKPTERDMSDNVILRRSNWSVKILSDKSRIECDEICDKLRSIEIFKRKFKRKYDLQHFKIISDSDEPRLNPDVKLFATNIDFEVVSGYGNVIIEQRVLTPEYDKANDTLDCLIDKL